MNTTCRACLNYTENGVRLLTLYKHYHYLPILIWNCTGVKVDDSDNDHKLPLCQPCADKLIDINEFRTMYLESHDKLKKNLKECLKYSPNDQKQPLNNNNSSHDIDMDPKSMGGAATLTGTSSMKKIKMNPDDAYNNIIIDESQLLHQSNNKENSIVDIAMSMASVNAVGVPGTTVTAVAQNSVVHAQSNGPAKKKASRPSKSRKKANATMVQMQATNNHDGKNILYENDPNLLDMNNGNGTGDASELQYIILQSDTKIFSCSNCEQQFISEDFLKQHIQKAHPIVTELVQTPALSPMSLNQQQQQLIYLCHFCDGKQFTSEIQLSHHMFIHSEISAGTLSDNPFPFCSCEHCLPLTAEKMIVGEDPTEAELVAMHQQMEEPPRQVVQTTTTITPSGKQQTLYSCSVCNKSTFKTEHRLKKHMRIHRNEQPFSCDICHKVYNASSSLKTHQRMAHGGVSSNSTANSVSNATNATETTTMAANAMADNNKSQQQHAAGTMNASIDAGPVQCSTCNKTFTKAYQLSVHMSTVHDKDRQYSCQYCSYRFSTAQKLNAHMRQHIESNDVILTTTQENEDDDTSNVEKITEITME